MLRANIANIGRSLYADCVCYAYCIRPRNLIMPIQVSIITAGGIQNISHAHVTDVIANFITINKK